MRRLLTHVAVGGLLLVLGVYFVVPLFLYSEGEAGELYDGYLMTDHKQADVFFDRLENVLKSESFQRSGGPTRDSIFASAPEAQTYWYSGSYRGSPPFTVAVMRAGPQLTSFHVSYAWNSRGFSKVRPRMRQTMDDMGAFLRDWSESRGASDIYTHNFAHQP